MKVLMIEPIGYSGICVYTAQLCRALEGAGCGVSLLTSRLYDPGVMKPSYSHHPVMGGCDRTQSRARRALDYLASWLRLPSILRRERPDIVHLQNAFVPFLDLMALLALRAAGYKVAYTVHDLDRSAMMTRQPLRIAVNRLVDRAVYRAVDGLIAHTDADLAKLRDVFGIPEAHLRKIPLGNWGFHLEGVRVPTSDEARRDLGLEPSAFIILFFGDRRPSKGLDLLIRALARVRKARPDARLLIAGEKRLLDTTDYAALAEREGVADICVFHDRFILNEDVPKYFAACDLVALPYRVLSQSAVVHLAFTFGKPVAASRSGGLAEVVEDGKTGFFIEDPEDVAGLAEALLKSCGDPERLAAMGAAARRVEAEDYGWEGIGRKTLEFYQAIRGTR